MQIIERKQREYVRFEAMRRFEEMTDIAERIGYPIDVTIPYELREGALYASTDTVSRPFHNQTYQALLAGERAFTGDQAFERVRLAHEHEEALLADKLAAGQLDGNVMIKLSKAPDAVVENRTSIKGYRRDLLRSFVRIYYRTPEGVDCRLFTLDHNNSAGMQQIGKVLGMDTTQGSEAVLANHTLLHVPVDVEQFVEELVATTIRTYDEGVRLQTGRESYAGSVYSSRQDAMSAIMHQPQLIDQHMAAIADIVAAGLGEARLETERERTAAAIKLAHEGYAVSSNADATVTAEVATGNYGGECATASSMGMNQAATMENIWAHGECQVCFARTMVGSCKVCAACAAADDRGVDLLKLRQRNMQRRERQRRLGKTSLLQAEHNVRQVPTAKPKLDPIQQRYGRHAVVRQEIRVGGTRKVVRDRRTNAVLSA